MAGQRIPKCPLASNKTTRQAILFFVIFSILAHHLTAGDPQQLLMEQFVKPAGQRFELEDGSPFYMTGTNMWFAAQLGMEDEQGGQRARLARDLDRLKDLGFNTIRTISLTLGPDDMPYRVTPSLMPSSGVYNEEVFKGLDFFLDALRERNMRAILVFIDFWHDTGGFSQTVAWADPTSDPVLSFPSYPDWKGDFDTFTRYAGRFYNDTSIARKCQNMLQSHIKTLLTRRNTINGIIYKEDPTIAAWEICNEPQKPSVTWIEATASFVKDIDSRHMLTTGLEGKEFVEYEDKGRAFFENVHSSQHIDFATVHLWVENWEIYKPYNGSDSNLGSAIGFARRFLEAHNGFAASFGKPLVLEEYGLARDSFPINMNRYDPKSPVTHRDKYFRAVLDQVSALSREGHMAGQMFWAWAGEGRPLCKMPVGDPPHENPGWYSVYDIDNSTMELFASFNKQLQADDRNY